MAVFNYGAPGLGHVGAYQVSGKPFVSGGIDVSHSNTRPDNTPLEINFPSVTRWITITNHDTTTDGDVKVAFSALGFDTNNFFTVSRDSQDYGDTMTARLELKVTRLYLTGACTYCDVIAGLTGIDTIEIKDNWSGSAGVG
jgi:hypothetical protein